MNLFGMRFFVDFHLGNAKSENWQLANKPMKANKSFFSHFCFVFLLGRFKHGIFTLHTINQSVLIYAMISHLDLIVSLNVSDFHRSALHEFCLTKYNT